MVLTLFGWCLDQNQETKAREDNSPFYSFKQARVQVVLTVAFISISHHKAWTADVLRRWTCRIVYRYIILLISVICDWSEKRTQLPLLIIVEPLLLVPPIARQELI